ncbi:hypothetical protein ACQPXS_47315 (plasmid) [Streptomyces sp. CA-142005]|uniref:hypothetical protein n=1 Tax=Streptomyces sp. CA-142005 TaxID=3240052 RepID=UPI003D8F9DA9
MTDNPSPLRRPAPDLTLASARRTPQLTDADDVARRAADHPGTEQAAQIAALLVTHPSPLPWTDTTVRSHARWLLTAAGHLPASQRPEAALSQLREALITAGDVDAYRLGQKNETAQR